MTEEQSDKTQVGLGSEADVALKAMVAEGVFASESVGYKFAVAYALSQDVSPQSVDVVNNKTKFAATGLDPDGRLAILVRVLAPETQRPYWAAERLADWGIRDLARRLAAHEDLAEILEHATKEPAA